MDASHEDGQAAWGVILLVGLIGLIIFLLLVGLRPDWTWWQAWR